MEKVIKEFPYKNTGMGGLIKYLVFLNGRQIYPSSTRRSRSGNHGSDYYTLTPDQWAKAWVIILQRTNSGKRDIGFSDNIPNEAREQLKQVWLYSDSWVDDIVQLAKALQLSLSLKNKTNQ